MTEFKSSRVEIRQSADYIYQYLRDFHNFESLLPEQVINWSATADKCSFTIKGMADLALVMGENVPNQKVIYLSTEPTPFEFSLNFQLEEKQVSTLVQTILSARLNPMIKMMASRPLQNFVDILTEKLKELMEQED